MIRKWPAGRNATEIAASIEEGIHRGLVRPHDRLPPVRTLAKTLGVSPVTVSAAYRLARTRGLVAGAGRLGTRVTPKPPSPTVKRSTPVASTLTDLASGNPDPALLPSLDLALRELDTRPHLYDDPPEWRPLMAFLRRELEADGISAKWLALVGGGLDGLERTLRAHLRPGDAVAVEDPCFPGVTDLIGVEGLTRVPFAVDDEGPLPDAFEAAVKSSRAVIVTPRAQNPWGAALTETRTTQLRRVLKAHPDRLLIENDPLGTVSGAQAITLTRAGSRHWVVVRSTSKILGPDLRFAAVAGDERTIARVEGRQALGTRWVSTILQRLTLALWSDPAHGRLLARAAEVYGHRRQSLLDALRGLGIAAHGRSGYNVWVPLRDEGSVVRALAERGWAVSAGERFRLQAPPGVRVTAATLEPDDARRFAVDLNAVLEPAVRFA